MNHVEADPTQPSETEQDAARTRSDRIEGFLGEYLKETMLWPVFIAVAAHAWVAISSVLLMVLRDRNPFAFFPLFVMGMGTLLILRHSFGRKHTAIPIMVISAWVLGGVLAWIADMYNVY